MRRLIPLSFLLCVFVAEAQHDNYNIYNVSADHGLPSNDLTQVFHDSFGFLWIGSYEGVFRWDGYAFKKYRHNEKDSTSINHNIVYSIFEDSRKRLWIGTIDGLNLYDRVTDTFIKCVIGQPGQKIPVNAIREDSKHQLWLGTSSGLCRYDYDEQKSIWFQDDNFDTIFCLSIDKDDNVWSGTFNGGVKKFSQTTNTFKRFRRNNRENSLISDNIKSIFCDDENRVWVGTKDFGIVVLNSDGDVLTRYENLPRRTSSGENTINCIYQDKNKRIWIGVGRQSLYYIDETKSTPQQLTETLINNPQNPFVSVTSIAEDSFGNTWFSTAGSGLFYTNVYKNVFQNFLQNRDAEGLRSATITCFLEDKRGTVWIGTESSGFLKADIGSKKFTPLNSTTHSLSNDAITDIKEDTDGTLWISTWNGGIMHFDPASRKIQSFVHNPADINSIPINDAKVVLPDDSLIWIGTHGEGLAAYDKKRNRFIHHKNNEVFNFQMNVPGWINHLYRDSFRRLWISTYSGLFVYDGKILKHFVHSGDTTSLSSNSVNMVTEDSYGRLWVATEAGLDEFDPKEENFVRQKEKFKLPESIKSIIIDTNNQLWISTNEGIFSVHPQTMRTKQYDGSDGLQGNSFFHKSVMRDKKGRLYFGGPRGFNVFHPDDLKEFELPTYFYTTDLYINNQLQHPQRNESPLESVLPFTDKLVLRPEHSFFSIEVSTVNLYSPTKTKYAYTLEGLHDQWIELNNERKISFTEIPPGSYRLKVRYTGVDGKWHEAAKSLRIEMLPPWWKTIWFKLFAVAMLTGAVVGLFYLRVHSIKTRNKLLSAEVEKRTHQLSEANSFLTERAEMINLQNERLEEYNHEILRQSEKILTQQKHITEQNHQLESTVDELQKLNKTKDHFFSILAHDLKNPISALTGISDFMKSNFMKLEKKEAMEYLSSIHKSSNAIYDLLTNLLNWSRTQSKNIEYSPTQILLSEIFQKNYILLEPQLNNKHITLTVESPSGLRVFADYNMLDTILRNILSNSVKFTEYNGAIRINAGDDGCGMAEISISDSGVGMSQEQLQKLFSLDKNNISAGTAGEKGTGLGLVITHEFVQINKGAIKVESTPGKGTDFRISIPTSKIPAKAQMKLTRQEVHSTVVPDFWETFPIDKLIKLKGKKILIIDDNSEIRTYLKLLLSGTFEIFEAGNGKDGLTTALDIQPTAIVTDLIMPVMNGLEFCKAIKENTSTSHIPVILLTSQSEEASQLSGYAAGADIYLTKPIRKELFIQVILNLIQNQEKLRQKIQENILSTHEFQLEESSLNKLDEEFLNKLVSFLEASIFDPNLDARTICEEFAMSRTVLYSKIKILTGQSVHEFIKSIRLKRSVILLLEGRLNISQIALEVGFNSHSYFDKCFTRQYGMGPKEYIAKKKHMRIG